MVTGPWHAIWEGGSTNLAHSLCLVHPKTNKMV